MKNFIPKGRIEDSNFLGFYFVKNNIKLFILDFD